MQGMPLLELAYHSLLKKSRILKSSRNATDTQYMELAKDTEADRKAGMENGNIRLSDGSIRVDLNAGADGQGVMAFALSHEFTHFVEEMSPAKFQAFTDILFEEMGKKGADVSALIEAKAQTLGKMEENKSLSENKLNDLAYSEVTAEMMETALTDTDVMERISARLQQTDKSLWGKIKDFLKGLVDRLKAAYKGMNPDSSIAQLARETINSSERVLDAFADAASDAVVNYRLQDGQKNNAPEGVMKSQRQSGQTNYDFTKPFAAQVDDWIDGKFPKNDTLLVGSTPKVFKDVGFNSLPVTLNQSHVDYAINGTKNADHTIGATLLKQLPQALESPVAIIASATREKTSTVALLPFTLDGNTVVAPVYVDGFGYQNSIQIDSNAVTSIYGRKNAVTTLLTDAINAQNKGSTAVFYLDTKKAAALYSVARVTMPKMPSTSRNGVVAMITDSGSPVKTKFSNVTESQQFKRWFGDWQNDPASAARTTVKHRRGCSSSPTKGAGIRTAHRTMLRRLHGAVGKQWWVNITFPSRTRFGCIRMGIIRRLRILTRMHRTFTRNTLAEMTMTASS